MKAFIGEFISKVEEMGLSKQYEERIILTLEEVAGFIGEKEPACIYPQNLFLNRDDFKFYTFVENVLVIATCNEYNILIEVLKLDDMERFEYQIDNETGNNILRIYFYGGKSFTFNSNLDTDRSHSEDLKKRINYIVKKFLSEAM